MRWLNINHPRERSVALSSCICEKFTRLSAVEDKRLSKRPFQYVMENKSVPNKLGTVTSFIL